MKGPKVSLLGLKYPYSAEKGLFWTEILEFAEIVARIISHKKKPQKSVKNVATSRSDKIG